MSNHGAKHEYEVEDLYIERLEQLGYEYVDLSTYDDVLRNFRVQLCKLNADELTAAKGEASLSDSEFERVMNRLEGKTIYESAKVLREKFPLTLDNDKSVYIKFFTTDETKNIYQVAHQITIKPEDCGGQGENRFDVTILINGLPLVQTELKRPGVEINAAIDQINRYRCTAFKGLFRYIQLFIVSNSTMTKYFANVNENTVGGERQHILKSLVFYWTDENNLRINRLMDFTSSFCSKFHLTEMLSKFFVIKESEPTLMVMRPYQVFAVTRAYDRIIKSNKNGYVFHTTGSGKTLTSYKLATLLRDDKRIDKVFFLIDRKDLDDQTVDEYNSFEKGCIDSTDNTSELIKSLSDSSKKLIVTTIQKMSRALASDKYAATIDEFVQKKCVFIIDECHRSQFGKMHTQIRKRFQNSNFIGFTGTPIFPENKSADGQTTADIFRSEGVEPCIHKYTIKEAIADGNVLQFSVEYLRSFEVKETEEMRIDTTSLDDAEYCRRNNISLDNLYHDDTRIANVAKHILMGLESRTRLVKNVYTALFAIDKIETLMKYYNYMKAHNPKGYKIAAIFTYQANQDMEENPDKLASEQLKECMDDYNAMFGTSYDLQQFDAYRKDISKRMKQKDKPQIDLLLVVNMFLTGFDSKPTNTLYLDKSLVWHSLVQAYSRTNRVGHKTKQFGQIATYRDIKKAQDEALKLYSGDNDPNAFLLQSYAYYKNVYCNQAETLRKLVPTPDDAGYLINEDEIKEFILDFRSLVGTLNTLKTFADFSWSDIEHFIGEEDFADYKSWYLEYYDRTKSKRTSVAVLADIDFDIELIRTDRINVVYILNLLKDISRSDKTKMDESIDLILREIERSDNEKLRYKKAIMEAFIRSRFFDLDGNTDIWISYSEFEKEVMLTEIEGFAAENKLDKHFLSNLVFSYFSDPKCVTAEFLRVELKAQGVKGLLTIQALTQSIFEFLQDCYNKFTSEDK